MASNTFYLTTNQALTDLAGAGRLVPGAVYDVNGVPFRAQSKTTFVAQDGETHTTVGYRGLVIGASGEERCYATVNLQANTISIDATARTASWRSIAAYPARAGKRVRVGANNNPNIELTGTIVSAVPESGGTRFVVNVDPGIALVDIAAGSIGGTSISMQDMQCWSTTASYTSMLSILSGGRLDITVYGSGGCILQDWVVPQRIAAVQNFGRADFLIIGIGIAGNSLNANAQSGDGAAAALRTLIETFRGQFRKIYVGDVSALTNEFGGGTGAGGVTSSTYSAGQRYLNALDELTSTYPGVTRVPVNAYEVVNQGQTDTTDVTNGFCDVVDKQDDGVHSVWGSAWSEAEAYWQHIRHDFPFRLTGARSKPFSVLRATTADPAGKFVRNLAEPMFGTVAQAGGVPSNCTGVVTGLGGITVTNKLKPSMWGSGTDWVVKVDSGGNVAGSTTQVSQLYTGTANSLLTQLNLARNQGVPVTIWWDCGIWGFNELTMSFVEVCIETQTSDGQGMLEVAAGLSINGLYNANGSVYATAPYTGQRGAQAHGFWGLVRFPPFTIPAGTVFTGAQIRQTAKPSNNRDPGVFFMRFGPCSLIEPAN